MIAAIKLADFASSLRDFKKIKKDAVEALRAVCRAPRDNFLACLVGIRRYSPWWRQPAVAVQT